MPPLFSIETDRVHLVWSLRRKKAVPVMPGAHDLSLSPVVQGFGGHQAVMRQASDTALLFEQTDYTLFVQGVGGTPVRVVHRDPVLLQGLHRSGEDAVVHGTINFGSQVGHSRFVVEAGGRPQFAFEVEVFPSKLDYRQDYGALLDDVQEIATELALEYLRATYTPGGVALGPPGVVAWALMLGHLADDLERALTYLNRHAYRDTHRTVAMLRTERIRRPDAAVRRALYQGAGQGVEQATGGTMAIQEYLPAAQGRYTVDTPAHRWLAAQLRQIRQRLAELHGQTGHGRRTPRRQQVRAELEGLQRRVARWLRLGVFGEAGGAPPGEPPLRLFTAPGYREAYGACLLLQRGLHLEGGPLGLGLKDLHLLYEYWCYLTLVRLAAEATGTTAPLRSLVVVEQRGLRVSLRKGCTQTVAFDLGAGGRLSLTYNPRFGGQGFLVPQQPDILLTVRKPGCTPARYVLDAKYRLDASPAYRRRYGLPGPPPDALNDLHRYRDALRGRGRSAAVVQALALYPFREEAPGQVAQSRHRRALEEIGIGALPLLPGATEHLEAWLRGVVEG